MPDASAALAGAWQGRATECAALKPFERPQRDGDARCDSVGSANVVQLHVGWPSNPASIARELSLHPHPFTSTNPNQSHRVRSAMGQIWLLRARRRACLTLRCDTMRRR